MQNFLGPGVDQRQVLFQGRGTDPRKIPAFRVKLPQQSVQVFVRPFLPCAVRIGEIHIAVQRFLYLSPTGELAPSVAGDRLYRFFRELGKRVYDRFRHRFSFPVRDLHRDIVLVFLSASVAKHALLFLCPDTTVSASQCPNSLRLYTLLSRLRMLFPVVNLPPFPSRFRVFPFLRKFFRVERRYLSSIQR